LESASTEEESEPKSGRMTGRVVNLSGFPISGARVSVTRDIPLQLNFTSPSWSGTTNRDGSYRVAGLPTDTLLMVSASAAGFQDTNANTRLTEGVSGVVELTLRDGVDLFGRVLSENGLPVKGALVRTEGFILEDSQGSRSGADGTVVTDENGRFHLGFKTPGTVLLRVATEEFGHSMFSNVPVGLDTEQDFRLKTSATVFGRVTDEAGNPVVGAEVEARGIFSISGPQGDGGSATVAGLFYRDTTFTNDHGDYRLTKLPSGADYRLRVLKGKSGLGPDTRALSDATSVQTLLPGEQREWNYQFRTGLRVRGTVVGERSGNLVKHSSVAYRSEGSGSEVEIIASDGTFDFTVYSPARYFVFPKLYMPVVDDSVDRGHWVPWSEGETAQVELRVPEPFSIGVRVVDVNGEPVQGARIQVGKREHEQVSYFFSSDETDSDGRYRYGYCLPGSEHWFITNKAGYISSKTKAVVGEPGVAYREQEIVLRRRGGLTAILEYDDGHTLYGEDVSVVVVGGAAESIRSSTDTGGLSLTGMTDGKGFFSTGKNLPEGILDLVLGVRVSEDLVYEARLDGVEVVPNEYTQFSRIVLTPKPK
jgi:protocatechuate 3,4-dioxygenase beta subunit